ncbi:MAG: hypothetical protein BWY81_01472 [Firmicutes bacterium ADurb.Bin467]|nr:MAG: hypothetical protein BWY81_01472 [Firmicutes bacterium ADurb.Bin467]
MTMRRMSAYGARKSVSGGRIRFGLCAPFFSTEMNTPSMCAPCTFAPLPLPIVARTASSAAPTAGSGAVATVGRNPVTPSFNSFPAMNSTASAVPSSTSRPQ